MDEVLVTWSWAHAPNEPLALTALALGVLALASAWRASSNLQDPRWRALTLSSTALFVSLLYLALLGPTRKQERRRPREASTVLLLDDSASMALPAEGGGTRYQRALSVARTLLRQMPEARVLDLAGQDLHLDVPSGEACAGPRPPAHPQRADSPLLARLSELIQRGYQGQVPDRVGLLSDLNEHGSGLAQAQLRTLERTLGVARHPVIFALDLGQGQAEPDLLVREIRVDTVAFYKNVTQAVVVVEARHLEAPLSVRVRFGVDGRWQSTQTLTLGPDTPSETLTVPYRPDAMGTLVLGAQIEATEPPAGFHERNLRNNVRLTRQRVLRDRLRILHLAGHPSWDVRFLRDALRESGQADLISFYIMVRPSAFFSEDLRDTALIPFPTKTLFEEELPGFDVLIFQNFPFGSFETDRYAPALVRFVRGGGALWVLGGEQTFLSEALRGSPFAELLPVGRPKARTFDEYYAPGPFHPRLTPDGKDHPILRGADMPRDLAQLLDALPPLEGTNRVGAVAQDALVLLTRPRSRATGGRKIPLLVTAEPGKGRLVYLGTDSLWRWAFQPQAPEAAGFYHDLVRNILRWLIRDPALAPFTVAVHPQDARDPDQGYWVEARPLHPNGAESHTWALKVRGWDARGSGPSDEATDREGPRLKALQSGVQARFPWRPERPGLYWLQVERREPGARVARSLPFLVEEDPLEFVEPSPRREAVLALIRASGGSVSRTRPDGAIDALRLPPLTRFAVVQTQTSRPLSSSWLLLPLLLLAVLPWLLASLYGD